MDKPKKSHARTRRGVESLPEKWRERIQVTMIVKRLNSCALGKLAIPQDQLRAAEILLRKVAPDLKAIDLSGHVETFNEVKVEFVSPKP